MDEDHIREVMMTGGYEARSAEEAGGGYIQKKKSNKRSDKYYLIHGVPDYA